MSNSTTVIRLSPEQLRVVEHRGGPLQVIACAGSGKTESIARRVAALIVEGAEPASVVAFTFTERAAAELKERIGRRVEEAKGREFLDRLGPMFVGTIHGYCFRLLQDHVPRFGNFDVLDEHRHAGLLSREYRNLGLVNLGPRHWQPIRDFKKTADVIANELIIPESLDGTPVGDCYRAYLAMLERFHFLTFGQLITEAIAALEDAAIFAKVHGPLRHLLVDEYQDINPAQERLIEMLARSPVSLCVVGDDDQSIYQWRGSDVRNIRFFGERRPGTTMVTLDSNRRCRPTIVSEANNFAASIAGRLPKAMTSVRSENANEIVPWSAPTEQEEAETVADTIRRLHDERGYRWRDIAVLYRSVRTSAPPLVVALRDREIPFSCAGRTGLFLQPEVALFGEIFAWFIDGDWKDSRFEQPRPADLNGIVAGLVHNFPDAPPDGEIRKYLEDWRTYQMRGLQPVSLVGDFYRLLFFLAADRVDVDSPQGSARFGAFARFSELLADFEHVNRRGRYVEIEGGVREFRGGRDRGKPYFLALSSYLLHYARDAYEDFEGEQAADLDAVDVLTVHQAKGLEWPVVFLPALTSARFPSRMAGRPQNWLLSDAVFPAKARRRYEGGDADERRLFYVALTRARDAVYLSYFERKTNRFQPSPYLVEIVGKKIPGRSTLPLPGPPEPVREGDAARLDVSYSDLALFEECGHRYRLGAVFGFQQELAVELGYGKAIHHVLRQVAEESRTTGTIPAGERLKQLIGQEFYLPFANAPAFDRMHKAASRLVRGYVDRWQDDLKRVWALERPFEMHVPDGIVKGRADVILDMEDGRVGSLAIVDYKVAEDEHREGRHRRQLTVYAVAGRGEGLDVRAAYLHELRDGTRHGIDIGEEASARAVEITATSVGRIRRAEYSPSPEAGKCAGCDYRRICRHREGLME